jgi:hypothetical protein
MPKTWEEFERERDSARIDSTKVLGNSISLINTPEHQRFWLPDRDYIYDMRVVTVRGQKFWRHHIVHNPTQRVIEQVVGKEVWTYFDIPLGHPNLSRLNLYAQELATRKYPRPYKRNMKGHKMKEAILYNVVNVNDKAKGLMESTYWLHQAQQFKAVQTIKWPTQTFEIVEIEANEPAR